MSTSTQNTKYETELKVSANKNEAILSVSGVLDQHSITKDYWHALAQKDQNALQQVKAVEIDLKDLQRSDTAGLAWLINLKRDINQNGGQASIANVPDALLNLADLSNAKTLLEN